MLTTTTSRKLGVLACLAALLSTSCGGGDKGITVVDPPAATVAFIKFVSQPGSVTAGQTLTVSVELVSASGVRVTTATSPVSLTVSGGAALGGTTTVNAVSGLATFSGISLTKAGVGFQITASSGTFTATSSAFAITAGTVDPAHSLFAPTSFTVNVATTLTFTFRDAYGNATPSATVSLATAAAGSTFTPASGVTGTDGTFVTSFRTTTGGSVTLTATVGGVAVPLTAAVVSTVGTVNVNIRDASSALIPATTYTITYTGGSSQFTATTGADVLTNVPAGAISVSASKTGYNTGTAAGTLVAGSTLTLNVVMAVASASCTPTAMTFPGTVNGTLSAASCQQNNEPSALYTFTVGATPGATFTLTPTGFTPRLTISQSPPVPTFSYINSSGTAITNVLYLLPSGTYHVRASATAGTGNFSLAGVSGAGLLTTGTAGGQAAAAAGSCPVFANLLVSIVITGQSLSTTDCLAGDNSRYDTYRMYSSAACTITLRSTAFDAYLLVYNLTTGALVRSDDDSGGGTDSRLVLTACNDNGNILELRANSFSAGEVGAYTLTVAIAGTASSMVAGSDDGPEIRLDRAPRLGGLEPALSSKGVKLPK